jgi:hypothetical protein
MGAVATQATAPLAFVRRVAAALFRLHA